MNTRLPEDQESPVNPGVGTTLLLDGFERVHELIAPVMEGLSSVELTWRPDAEANSIGWLLWHLLRVEDSHMAELEGADQVWTEEGWSERLALPYDDSSVGFGHTSQEVGQFFIEDPTLLIGYHEAVHARTKSILTQIPEADYDNIIDDSYHPPVTAGSRLVSVVNDTTQHMGQASYVRGLVERRSS